MSEARTFAANVPPPANHAGGASLHSRFRKRYSMPGREFVLDVDCHAPAGFTILFGASGAGKTTLLDCVAGLATPDEGSISVGDRILFDSSQRISLPLSKRRIGYVFQSLALFPHMTVAQNVEYGLSHLRRAERHKRILASNT